MRKRIGLSVVFVLFCTVPAFAQYPDYDVSSDTYGVNDEVAHVITAWELVGGTSTTEYSFFVSGRYATNGGAFLGTVRLPAGAVVNRFEMDACDNSSVGEVTSNLQRCTSPFNACIAIGSAFTGVSFTDGGGCLTVEKILDTPEVIDNEANIYLINVANPGNNTQSTRINAIRIYYKLQISPAPGTATFADVPTSHPLFQFVEALVASGITAGCRGGNFCPNDPLTRGQMAVFLAKALGLHWAP